MWENATETNRIRTTPKHVRGDIWLLDIVFDENEAQMAEKVKTARVGGRKVLKCA